MMKIINRAILFTLSINAYALNDNSYLQNFFDHLVVSLSGGPSWLNPGQNQNIYFQDSDFFNSYKPNSNFQTNGFGELFVGRHDKIFSIIDAQFGPAISGVGMAKVQGQVWQYGLSEFYNDNYTYNVNQFRVALRGKLIPEYQSIVKPYLTGSVGIGFNRSFSFYDTPLIDSTLPGSRFMDNTQTAFTYTAGAGLQANIYKKVYFAVGYEFMDWGKSALGSPSNEESSPVFGMSHLYSNMLLFSLSYIA